MQIRGITVLTTTGRTLRTLLITVALPALLGACDMIQQKMGYEDPAIKAARVDGEGRAVGGACRQSGRAIEDCYSIYSWLPKSAIYDGWRDMDAYMRDNKLETVEPQLPPTLPPGVRRKPTDSPESKPADSKTTKKNEKPAPEKK